MAPEGDRILLRQLRPLQGLRVEIDQLRDEGGDLARTIFHKLVANVQVLTPDEENVRWCAAPPLCARTANDWPRLFVISNP